MSGWEEHVAREERRYRDGMERVPEDPDARQKQLTRVANAACGAGLAYLMDQRAEEARHWFVLAAERYRESFAHAPPESFGRLIGVVKMRLLAGDERGAAGDARWALEHVPPEARSPIGRYAACLAALVLRRDRAAAELAHSLQSESPDAFPRPVADALAGLATGDGDLYAAGLSGTLRSFEMREAYLEDVTVADTVLALEALAEPRGLARRPHSRVLPARSSG